MAAKSDDSEAVSRAAAEHARRLVKVESEKERAEAAIRDVERELVCCCSFLVSFCFACLHWTRERKRVH